MVNTNLSFRLFIFLFFTFLIFAPLKSYAQGEDKIIVIPFENTSDDPREENNWIGESFSDQLTDLLNVPGLKVVSTKQRQLVYQQYRLPLNVIPSRATSLLIAREAKATHLVIGDYKIIPAQGDVAATVLVKAFLVKVNEGRLQGNEILGGKWDTRLIDLAEPVTKLQGLSAKLAYQILLQQFGCIQNYASCPLTISQKELENKSDKIPPLAFEAFIKGILTKEMETRINYFKNAMRLYTEANPGKEYHQAAYELGLAYMKLNDWRNAAEYFTKVQKEDRNYADAVFFASLAYWQLKDPKAALNVLLKLSDYCSITGVYINTGAMSLFTARDEKNPDEKARLIDQAVSFLERASATSPNDLSIRFNYGYALFVLGKYKDAIDQLRTVVEANKRDGQALFILAKSLEKSGKTVESEFVDNQARLYLPNYAKWQTAWLKNQSTDEVSLQLRQVLNAPCIDQTPTVNPSILLALMDKAKQFIYSGNYDEALKTLRQVLTIEPMNAEAYYFIGVIHEQNGDQDAAISALKTSIFWNNNFINSHILLTRIFIAKGECGLAKAHANTAKQLNANNQEVIGLQRILEMGTCK